MRVLLQDSHVDEIFFLSYERKFSQYVVPHPSMATKVASPYTTYTNNTLPGNFTVTYGQSGGHNYIENAPQQINTTIGIFTIVVTDNTTLYTWSVQVGGGMPPVPSYNALATVNCTATQATTTVLQVNSGDGREYFLDFYGCSGGKIEKVSGAGIAGTITINIVY